jgi:hypothetical protein
MGSFQPQTIAPGLKCQRHFFEIQPLTVPITTKRNTEPLTQNDPLLEVEIMPLDLYLQILEYEWFDIDDEKGVYCNK